MNGIVPTIYLVDDDKSVLVALSRLLTTAGYRVEAFECAEAFLRSHDQHSPGCAVLDLELPGIDGFGVQERLCVGATRRQVIFLTGRGSIPSGVRAIKAGAVDFLTKPVEGPTLLDAVSLALARDVQERASSDDRAEVTRQLATLTPREGEVLTLVVAGRLNKQIAAELGIAERTTKIHRGRMMKKMGVRTVADLVRLVSLHDSRNMPDGIPDGT
jgi:FixJ family two-component response regulator